ncbi:MAG TPA: bifunctional UDP-sugar hydrolase/5'-nucleotidase [Bacteroidota bacterium]|nr:bifunctional UDP-sugar hydrolase/5'-nucleotidase [Bacteroidota bacterium]
MILIVGALMLLNQASGQTRIRILFTHDLHTAFEPETHRTDEGQTRSSGGFARLASAIRTKRLEVPGGTLVVDAGDYSSGTIFSTLYTSDGPELQLMGMMGYDAVTPGNHEFDDRLDGFAQSVTAASRSGNPLPLMVSSNVTLHGSSSSEVELMKAFGLYGVRKYTVIERSGIRIGIFGVIGKDASADVPGAGHSVFEDPIVTAKNMARVLRDSARVDLIVCLSHSGTRSDPAASPDEALAREVPEIDVIISGHTHRTLVSPLVVGRTIIGSAGAHGAALGIMDLVLTPNAGPKLKDYRLMQMTDSIQPDSVIARRIAVFTAKVDSVYFKPLGMKSDQILAELPFDLEPMEYVVRSTGELALGDLIADGFSYAVGCAEGSKGRRVDFSIEPLGLIRGSFLKGPVTVADVFRALSLGVGRDKKSGYPLVSAYMTGSDLRKVLEIDATLSALKTDLRFQVAGVTYHFNPHRMPFNRITESGIVDASGTVREIEDERLYRGCISWYAATMISKIDSMSHGIISLVLRDSSGAPLHDLDGAIVMTHTGDHRSEELKDWQALAMYLQSFPRGGSLHAPIVPARYLHPDNRIISNASWNPIALLARPNRYTIVPAVFVVTVLALLSWALFAVRRWIRVRRSKH